MAGIEGQRQVLSTAQAAQNAACYAQDDGSIYGANPRGGAPACVLLYLGGEICQTWKYECHYDQGFDGPDQPD